MKNFRKANTTKNFYYFSLGYYYFSGAGIFSYKKIKDLLSNGFYRLNYIYWYIYGYLIFCC